VYLSDDVPFPRLEYSVAVSLPETEFSDELREWKKDPSWTLHLSDVVPLPRLENSAVVPLPETEFSNGFRLARKTISNAWARTINHWITR